MKKSYVKSIIVGQLNKNSLRNKFSSVKELLPPNLHLLIIKETRIDDSFPNAQFLCKKVGATLMDVSVFT